MSVNPALPRLLGVEEQYCDTKLNLMNFNYKWRIHQFILRPEKTGEALVSPTFSVGTSKELKWRLNFYPNGVNEECKDFVSVFVELVLSNKSELKVDVKISMLNENGGSFVTARSVAYIKQGHSLGGKKFIKRDTLINNENRMKWMPNNILTIFCEVSVAADSVSISGQANTFKQQIQDEPLKDFEKLLDHGNLSDVTFLVGNREFKAHKAILAARSDIFAAMFKHEMVENVSNRVTISDVEPEVLAEMLRFIYTGKSPNVEQMAESLLAAANKYCIQNLKLLCEEALCARVLVETVADMLILADLHNANELKAKTLHFISSHATTVMNTSGWGNMKIAYPHLIEEAFCALAMQQKN